MTNPFFSLDADLQIGCVFLISMILVFYNPISGNGKSSKVCDALEKYLSKLGLDYNIYESKKTRDNSANTKSILKELPSLIISCGGDGTAHDVMNALDLNDSIPVLILPAGTGNDFSTRLYGSVSPEKLFPLVLSENYAFADLGKCNDMIFVNGIGIGFDGAISRDTQNQQRKWLPPMWKYYLAIARNVLFYNEINLKLDASNYRQTFMLALANGPCYGGGFNIAPGAEVNDGWLDLVHIGRVHPLLRPFYIPKVKNGKHLGLRFTTHQKVQNIHIQTPNYQNIPAHADGEYFENHIFNISIIPKALKYPI